MGYIGGVQGVGLRIQDQKGLYGSSGLWHYIGII